MSAFAAALRGIIALCSLIVVLIDVSPAAAGALTIKTAPRESSPSFALASEFAYGASTNSCAASAVPPFS